MRRFLLVVISSLFILTGFSQSKGFSRWSFTPEYGYNYFDGDINQDLLNIIPTSFRDVTYGANLEYALTPIWGLSLDGYFFPLRAKNNSPVPMYINSDLYTGDLNATINFTRLIFPNTKSRIYFLGSIGLGYAFYKYNLKYLNGTPIPATDTYVDQKYNGQTRTVHLYANGSAMTHGVAGSCPVTFSMEYNFSKPLAIGAKIHYRAYTKDNLEGVTYLNWDGVTNDYIAAGTIYLRYKFRSLSKDHLRNITCETYQPDKGLLLAKELEGKLNKLNGKVDKIDAKVDSLLPRVARLESLLSNDGPDTDGDGVPDVRDKDNSTPANTPVDFWGKAMPIAQYATGSGYNSSQQKGMNPADGMNGNYNGTASPGKHKSIYIPDDVPAVYFDFDQIVLDDDALITISKIAAKMKKDPSLYVEVRGYCDYMGNNPYNNLLAQRRSDRVKAELVKVWGVPFDHVISNGKGKIIEPRVKYRPNRRCDFFFGRL